MSCFLTPSRLVLLGFYLKFVIDIGGFTAFYVFSVHAYLVLYMKFSLHYLNGMVTF